MRTLYNPSLEDISTDVDKYGEKPQYFTLKAGNIAEFEDFVADLLKEKLVERMLWENPPNNKNYEKRRIELREIIEVKNG